MVATVERIDSAEKKAHKTVEKTRTAVNEGLDKTEEKVTEGLDTAQKKVNKGLDKAHAKISDAADTASRRYGELREKAQHASEVTREKYDATVAELQRGYEQLHGQVTELRRDFEGYAQENPLKTAAIAGGVGFFVGLLLRGRGRGRS